MNTVSMGCGLCSRTLTLVVGVDIEPEQAELIEAEDWEQVSGQLCDYCAGTMRAYARTAPPRDPVDFPGDFQPGVDPRGDGDR